MVNKKVHSLSIVFMVLVLLLGWTSIVLMVPKLTSAIFIVLSLFISGYSLVNLRGSYKNTVAKVFYCMLGSLAIVASIVNLLVILG